MNNELLHHLIQTLNDCYQNDDNDFSELHNNAFNTDYYIVGHYNAEQWLQEHGISPFEAIATIMQWQEDTFGDVTLNPHEITPEKVVNLYVYIKGDDLLSDFDLDQSKAELLADFEHALNQPSA